jgi:hypothetical protein
MPDPRAAKASLSGFSVNLSKWPVAGALLSEGTGSFHPLRAFSLPSP